MFHTHTDRSSCVTVYQAAAAPCCRQLQLYQQFHAECDISVSKLLGFETFPFFWIVLDSVSKKIDIKKRYQFGIGKIWYRKSIGFGFVQIFGIVTHWSIPT